MTIAITYPHPGKTGNGSSGHHKHLQHKQHKAADRVDDGHAQNVLDKGDERIERRRAERFAKNGNLDVRVLVEELEALLKAPEAA